MNKIIIVVIIIVGIAHPGICEETSTTNSPDAKYEQQRIKQLNYYGLNLQSKDEVKQSIYSTWHDFRKTLSAGDLNNAVNYISTKQREKYRGTLNLYSQYTGKVAASLTDIENCEIESNALQVDCEMFNKVNGELRSHYVQFIRDSDGTWRILFF